VITLNHDTLLESAVLNHIRRSVLPTESDPVRFAAREAVVPGDDLQADSLELAVFKT
jgi:hypothetical protein